MTTNGEYYNLISPQNFKGIGGYTLFTNNVYYWKPDYEKSDEDEDSSKKDEKYTHFCLYDELIGVLVDSGGAVLNMADDDIGLVYSDCCFFDNYVMYINFE